MGDDLEMMEEVEFKANENGGEQLPLWGLSLYEK